MPWRTHYTMMMVCFELFELKYLSFTCQSDKSSDVTYTLRDATRTNARGQSVTCVRVGSF